MTNQLTKETFYSNLTGTTIFEVILVTSVFPVSVLLSRQIARIAPKFSSLPLQFALEYLLVALPVLVSFTFTTLTIPLLTLMLVISTLIGYVGPSTLNANVELSACGPRPPFMTSVRSGMMLGTCIAILAVDFVIFPRRFAKTETFGVSVMDVGVGSVTVLQALAWRGAPRSKRSVLVALPLLLLGFARLASVKATDYHEHVSEYGVHWNFFFTLAAVMVLATVIGPQRRYAAVCAIVLIVGYQAALSNGLTEYILDAPRRNLISMNKEGVFSCVGYGAIFLAATTLRDVFRQSVDTKRALWRRFGNLCLLDALLWGLMFVADAYIQPISRRMANLAYVLFVLAHSLFIILATMISDLLCAPVFMLIHDSINRNQLALFLIGNLGTGAVNLSINTLHCSDMMAFGILNLYTLSLCAVAVVLHRWNVTLKFW
eukprot:TRINITY_DN1130_c0_g1_i5.p1 TRINITY_DN1130_c0_g1~~TRINITY_DN1130_c0_g1_i5.p1  ORF type:complete len:431 (-),score=67.30 TRINITY_DN1130_c0_g1_i5:1871-3163(-)